MTNTIVRKAFVYSVILLLVSSIKTLPFAYVLRFYYQVVQSLTISRSKFHRSNRTNTYGITGPDDLFQWVTLDSYVSPFEIDMYMHKSNSTYFLDLDIARTKLVVRVFQKLFLNFYDNIDGEFKSKGIANYPYIPIATVQCSFKRELKPFQRFRISSRVFAWDHKWLFVLSKFTTGPDEKLHAYALTKYVFKKKGRITMVPEEYIKEAGLWDEHVAAENVENYKMVQDLANNDSWEGIASKDGKLTKSGTPSITSSRVASTVNLAREKL